MPTLHTISKRKLDAIVRGSNVVNYGRASVGRRVQIGLLGLYEIPPTFEAPCDAKTSMMKQSPVTTVSSRGSQYAAEDCPARNTRRSKMNSPAYNTRSRCKSRKG